MIKRLTVAVAALFVLAAQAFAAGTVPGFSLTPQFDLTGKVAPGCFLYVVQAGTVSTPQQPYQDSGLTLLAPNPLRCDAAGRLPQWFVADGSIKVRLTKSDGTGIFVGDNLLVVGASSGGGGGSPVDATTVLATGDVKPRYGTGVLDGFVRMNGRTIGSASSGATERANSDTQALFEFLWGADPNLTVSGGRGATANADWVANKTIALPDMRGRLLGALSDMGNIASSTAITGITCGTPSPATLGVLCGTETRTITQANLPSLTWPTTLGISNTLGISDPGHSHLYTSPTVGSSQMATSNQTTSLAFPTGNGATTGAAATGIALSGSVSITGSVTSGGSGTALGILPPTMLITMYVKL